MRTFADCSFNEMLDAIARRLQKPEISKAPATERPRLLNQALAQTRTLLVLDNLETLTDGDRRYLATFLQHLPSCCKALLTSRLLLDVTAADQRIKIEPLDPTAALQTLADIANNNPALASASKAEFLRLIEVTGGNTLLMIWTAQQVGRGDCDNISGAIDRLCSCPKENDPIKFIFGGLFSRLAKVEQQIVATLSYPKEPIPVAAIADISGIREDATRRALKLLTNYPFVVCEKVREGEDKYSLVPMVAEFVQSAQRPLMEQIGNRLAARAYRLIDENGHDFYKSFPVLQREWPTIEPALPIYLSGANLRLQKVCKALNGFLNFQGHRDIWLTLNNKAEEKAVHSNDFLTAGWVAYRIGWIHKLSGNAGAMADCVERVEKHWKSTKVGPAQRAAVSRLRGAVNHLNKDFTGAIHCFGEALKIDLKLKKESIEVVDDLNWLGGAEKRTGNHEAVLRHWKRAARIAKTINYTAALASFPNRLACLALDKKDWHQAEMHAREALPLSEKIHRDESIGRNHHILAEALLGQGKYAEAKKSAQHAVDTFTLVASPYLEAAKKTLAACDDSHGAVKAAHFKRD